MFKVLVTGSRDWGSDEEIQKIFNELNELPAIFNCKAADIKIIHGDCRGVDKIAHVISIELGFNVKPYTVTSDEWKIHGLKAGPMRNQKMYDLEKPVDLVLAFHANIKKSKGTKNMCSIVEKHDPLTKIKIIT